MSHATDGENSNPLLRLEDVSLIYKERTSLFGEPRNVYAVDGVTLDVLGRKVIALAGESGCGKTTLGKVIVALLKPTAGTILYKGKNLWKLSRREWKESSRSLQMIHQDPYQALNPSKTVFQILGAPIKYHKLVKSGREQRERVDELLSMVGLQPETVSEKYPHQLSGGQRQRVVIARAVSLNPELVVADEPVSMIDVSLRIDILDLMLDLRRKFHMGTIFITHDLGLARYFTREGRIIIMYLGNIVEVGPTEDVIQNPLHPYTKALHSVVPIPDPKMAEERKPMALRSLDIPSASNPPSGCKFHPRCPFANERCSQERPEMIEVKKNRYVACFTVK